ncbi:MAG TPA: hypothetical protein VIQ52_06685, partial [Arthrobacter sp.]
TAAAYGTLQMVLILLVLVISQRLESPRRTRKSRTGGPRDSGFALTPVLAPMLNPTHETGDKNEDANEPVNAAP